MLRGKRALGGLHVEEDACGFSHAFSQPSGPGMLEVELPLRYWLCGNNVSRVMLLDSLGGTNLHFLPISTKLYFKVVVFLQSLVCNRPMFAILLVVALFYVDLYKMKLIYSRGERRGATRKRETMNIKYIRQPLRNAPWGSNHRGHQSLELI